MSNYVGGVPAEVPYDCTVQIARIAAYTGPTGADLTVDIWKNNLSTILGGSKLKIVNGSSAGTTATFASSPLEPQSGGCPEL